MKINIRLNLRTIKNISIQFKLNPLRSELYPISSKSKKNVKHEYRIDIEWTPYFMIKDVCSISIV